MIVSSSQARQILAGRKTQMRVRVQREREVTRPNGTTYTSVPFTPREGMRVPIAVRRSGDNGGPVCHIIIDRAWIGSLGDIGLRDALAEGHKTTTDFKVWWVNQHDRVWVERREPEADPGQAAERFDRRWSSTAVWAFAFHRDPTEQERYPAATGRGDERGYTTSPAEAIDDASVGDGLLKVYATEARERDAARAAGVAEEDLELLRELDATIANLKALGLRTGVSFHAQVKAQQQVRNGVERKIREQVARRQQAA